MRRKEGRTIGLYFKVSPAEMALIEEKMEQAGTLNKRAYLRKMAVDGYIVHVDMGSVKELVKLLRSIAGNVNQIARRCNETRNLYGEDVEDLRKGYVEVQKEVALLVGKFVKL
ncbi:MAG: MobC family plasmid mobilization relaxosome protein [Acetatifactor sp.]|nr:MobC family plasmid mobilization relaxosome protein [Acetatifactor sp.]